MTVGTKEPYHQDTRSRFHAGAERIPYKVCRLLAVRSLADSAHHYPCHYRYCYNLPHLETQEW